MTKKIEKALECVEGKTFCPERITTTKGYCPCPEALARALRSALKEKDMVDFLLSQRPTITEPWPVTVNGRTAIGTRTFCVSSRSELRAAIRASKSGRKRQ